MGKIYQFPSLFYLFMDSCLQYCSQMHTLFVLALEPFLFQRRKKKTTGKQQGSYRYSLVKKREIKCPCYVSML